MQVESALGPALQAAYTVMQDYGGKMLVFQNAVPSLGAPLTAPALLPCALFLVPCSTQPSSMHRMRTAQTLSA